MARKVRTALLTPLGIIAGFSALAEASVCIALLRLSGAIQGWFLGFAIIFPLVLISLFFRTLWKYPGVLYAPRDFADESNFLPALQSFGPPRATLPQSTPTDADRPSIATVETLGPVRESASVTRTAPLFADVGVLDPIADGVKYLGLRGFRLSDVRQGDASVLYSFGSYFGFTLWDSDSAIVFCGTFHESESRDATARVACLLKRITSAYSATDAATDEAVKASGRRVLDLIRIEVLVRADTDIDGLPARLDRLQPSQRRIEVIALSPEMLHRALEAKYVELGL